MTRSKVLLVLLGLGVVGCGGGTGNHDGSGPPANIPRTDTFSTLSQSQTAALCDYIAETNGGYGAQMTCPNGDVQANDPSQSECMASAAPIGFYCPTFTVGQAEDCATAVGLDICNVTLDAACSAYEACLTQLSLAP